MSKSAQVLHLLLVEDDDVDAEQIARSFRQQQLAYPITVAKDGLEALAVLRGEEGHEPLPRPYIVLLDINMPRMNGLEFLDELRADTELRRSIVFVLTTSNRHRDMRAAYHANVAGYFLKQSNSTTDSTLAEMLSHYGRIVAFPGEH